MAADDDFRAGEGMAIEWLEGRSEMSDDLVLLVSGMTQPLDGTARAFLLTVGNAARSVARREDLRRRQERQLRAPQTSRRRSQLRRPRPRRLSI